MDSNLASGRAIYNTHCYFCHGYSGDARTIAARYLDPKPRDFTALKRGDRSRTGMIRRVSAGVDGSAMMAFGERLSRAQIEAVVDYIRSAFMLRKERNMRYHSPENGWYDHEQRNHLAYPFALGEIPIDRPWSALTPEQRQGRRLFMSACITCHDRPRVNELGPMWSGSAVSYPRGGYVHRRGALSAAVDARSFATPYGMHERPPQTEGLTALEHQGEALFQANCAFCHAADGTGKGWIGRFLDVHPRNLTDTAAMKHLSRQGLKQVIRDGLPGTTMSAWKTVLNDQQMDALVAYITRVFIPLKR